MKPRASRGVGPTTIGRPRTYRSGLLETLCYTAGIATLAHLLVVTYNEDGNIDWLAFSWWAIAGAHVDTTIIDMLTAVATLIAGLYVTVTFGEIAGQGEAIWRKRRQIGLIAQVGVALITPAVVANAAYHISEHKEPGKLLTTAPFYIVSFACAGYLARYVGLLTSEALALTERRISETEARIPALHHDTPRELCQILRANSVACLVFTAATGALMTGLSRIPASNLSYDIFDRSTIWRLVVILVLTLASAALGQFALHDTSLSVRLSWAWLTAPTALFALYVAFLFGRGLDAPPWARAAVSANIALHYAFIWILVVRGHWILPKRLAIRTYLMTKARTGLESELEKLKGKRNELASHGGHQSSRQVRG